MKSALHFLISLVLLSVLTGCQGKTDNSDKDRVDQAQTLLSAGQYTEAIDYLESQPGSPSPEVQMVLASAYAGRAGLRVQKYWGFIVGEQMFPTKEQKQADAAPLIDLSLLPSGTSNDVKKVLKGLNANMAEYRAIEKRVIKIPVVPYEQRPDVQKAVQVLTDIPTPGGHLFRAILEVILVRSAVENITTLAQAWGKTNYDLCSDRFSGLNQWVTYSLRMLAETTDDVAVAFPSKKDMMTDWKGQLTGAVNGISQIANTMMFTQGASCAKGSSE